MSRFIDALIAQVLTLEVQLRASQARLAARTDAEALHDLRIALRRLRSLLRPLRDLPGVEPLRAAAGAVGELSGPLRDLEVLLPELREKGLSDAEAVRLARLEAGYEHLLASSALERLFRHLDAWPALWRQAQYSGALSGLRKRVRKRLVKQRRQLARALRDPAHDRHRLRLLIKRVRYGFDAYPELIPVGGDEPARLKAAQSALGDWHDRLQWLARAEAEPDLQPLASAWRAELTEAEQRADQALELLLEHFPER